jgi:hypothetical protein
MKRLIIIVSALIIILFTLHQVKLSYGHFTIENVNQEENITYEKYLDDNYTLVKIRVKGEIKGGSAVLKLYPCGDNITNTRPIFTQTITGKIDTTWSNDYYFKKICAHYKPKEVIDGDIDISISIR